MATLNLTRTDRQVGSQRAAIIQLIKPIPEVALTDPHRSFGLGYLLRLHPLGQFCQHGLGLILFQALLLLLQPRLFLPSTHCRGRRRQIL